MKRWKDMSKNEKDIVRALVIVLILWALIHFFYLPPRS
jgi:hypothetical protein